MPSTSPVPRPPAARTHPSWYLLPLQLLWMANKPLELKEVLEGPPALPLPTLPLALSSHPGGRALAEPWRHPALQPQGQTSACLAAPSSQTSPHWSPSHLHGCSCVSWGPQSPSTKMLGAGPLDLPWGSSLSPSLLSDTESGPALVSSR